MFKSYLIMLGVCHWKKVSPKTKYFNNNISTDVYNEFECSTTDMWLSSSVQLEH